jgi:hypothetical protein
MADVSPIGVRVEFDMEEVHNLSVDLLGLLEDEKVTIALGMAALGLSIGRLASPAVLDQPTEIKFTQDLMEWLGMYFNEGTVN